MCIKPLKILLIMLKCWEQFFQIGYLTAGAGWRRRRWRGLSDDDWSLTRWPSLLSNYWGETSIKAGLSCNLTSKSVNILSGFGDVAPFSGGLWKHLYKNDIIPTEKCVSLHFNFMLCTRRVLLTSSYFVCISHCRSVDCSNSQMTPGMMKQCTKIKFHLWWPGAAQITWNRMSQKQRK